jgi:hypothetical protein
MWREAPARDAESASLMHSRLTDRDHKIAGGYQRCVTIEIYNCVSPMR